MRGNIRIIKWELERKNCPKIPLANVCICMCISPERRQTSLNFRCTYLVTTKSSLPINFYKVNFRLKQDKYCLRPLSSVKLMFNFEMNYVLKNKIRTGRLFCLKYLAWCSSLQHRFPFPCLAFHSSPFHTVFEFIISKIKL